MRLEMETEPPVSGRPLTTNLIRSYVSSAIREKYLSIGFSPEKLVQIPNGVKIQGFRPIPAGERLQLKHDLGFF